MRLLALFLMLAAAMPCEAETTARLVSVADDLEGILADLEEGQLQTQQLRDDLAALKSISLEQQSALERQESILASYQASVAALEDHDRASLALAMELRGQLEAERRLTSWLWPVAAISLGLAVVEAGFLVALR